MSDPLDDELRRALSSGAADFLPPGRLGATRARVVGSVRRRQRQRLSLVVAAVALVSTGAVAWAVAVPGPSSSQRVAARGANRGVLATGIAGTSPPAVAGSVGSAPGGNIVVPPKPGLTPTSTTRPRAPATTVAPVATTATSPPTTRPGPSVPTTTPPGTSRVQGTVRFSPTCPLERIPPDPACAPRPGAAHIELLRADGTVAAQGDAGASGDFAIPVAPGSYRVTATAIPMSSIGQGCGATPAQVTVAPGADVTVAVSCDTGIR